MNVPKFFNSIVDCRVRDKDLGDKSSEALGAAFASVAHGGHQVDLHGAPWGCLPPFVMIATGVAHGHRKTS